MGYIRLIREEIDSVVLTEIEEETKERREIVIKKRNKRKKILGMGIGRSRIIAQHSGSNKEKEETEKKEGELFAGVYGEIDVNDGTYLVCIKESRKVGEVEGYLVHEALSCRAVCIDGFEDPAVQSLFDEFFKIPGLYFSECSLAGLGLDTQKENTDFIYNYIPLSKYRQKNEETEGNTGFGIELVQGYFGQANLTGKINIQLTLLSRRSWRNAGTRYYARGADPNGDAANTVETLLIAQNEAGEVKHFLQCRGSIPLAWEQKIDLSYKPPVRMGNPEVSRHLFLKHMSVLHKRYRRYFFINLLDTKGHEKELNSEFIRALDETECEYLAVDYHTMVKSAAEKEKFKKELKSILSEGCIIRTNCVDCLDRTNVVQSQISKIKLLEMFGLPEKSENQSVLDIDDYLNQRSVKKLGQLWNSNANMLSMQYTGTSALKNDLTEHGVRTFKGLIQDAISSGKRYVNNNFTDGKMHEIIEVATGVRNSLGNSIRGDRKILMYIVISLVVTAYIYTQLGAREGQAALICVILLFRSVMYYSLSFPSPQKKTGFRPESRESTKKKSNR